MSKLAENALFLLFHRTSILYKHNSTNKQLAEVETALEMHQKIKEQIEEQNRNQEKQEDALTIQKSHFKVEIVLSYQHEIYL